MPLVVELRSAADLAAVGGKARNLGILLRAGFRVPPGFCVTTDAYRSAVADRLDEVLTELGRTDPADQAACHRLAARARSLIESAPVPPDVEAAVRAAYAALGSTPSVAVRSSATAEDLEGASFAGQQDTYLNVVGADDVVSAVRRCWASLWTDRAVSYRAGHGIDPSSVALAVVVQVLVDAVAAGVMFTADPVTGTRGHAVIDASPGLGEAVVSGSVNPDHLVVDAASGLVLERRLGDKRVAVRPRAGGGVDTVELDDGSANGCLSDAQAMELARLGAEVERHYGAPQDTEWALDASARFWLTQSRPVTTLYPVVTRPDRDDPRVFLNLSLAQGLTRPITPMGLATFGLIARSVARVALRDHPVDPTDPPHAFQVAGRRAFVDSTAALRHPLTRRLVFAALGVMEARAAAVLKSLVEDPRFAGVERHRAGLAGGFARVMIRTGLPIRVLVALISPPTALRQIDRAEARLRHQLTLPARLSAEQRLDAVEQFLATETFLVMPRNAGYAIPGFALLGLVRRLLRGRATGDDLQTVLRGLPNNVTTEMDLALWQLSEQVRADPASREAFGADVPELTKAFVAGELPGVAQRGLTAFLDHYGHRAVAEIDLGMPRWSEEPQHLLGVIRNYLALEDAALAPPAQFAAGRASAELMVAELIRRAGGSRSLRGRVVAFGLDRTRQLAGLRERPKYVLVLQLALLRAQLQRVGETLARRGVLDAADDIFFVDVRQARRGLGGEDLRATVAAARAGYAAELARRHIPRLLLNDGTEPEATLRPADAPPGALLGSPASAGTVTAPARVVLDPVGAHLVPGEILVAPSTDPGWTPLFLTAGGLVMEMGGANSHGAVVAREYGIPAVVGVAEATQRIATGDLITVDGAAGLVTRNDPTA
ncbi:MAG TPA: PEP/pyruvate-binding domain-containing protein [Microlunatus sp.]|nr:PEP/pyruvate-binding domain-containing protein [Microlunatus sp.]